VTYKENTIKVELENEAVIKTETIVIDSPRETKTVTIKAEKDNKGVIIVAVALTVIAMVMLAVCFFKIVRPRQEVVEL